MSTEAPKREAGARTFSSRTDLPAIHEAWLPREHSLHRPRHGGRQLVSLICAAVFFATPLVALTLGVRPAEFENRRLIPFPSPGAGWDFLTGLDPWASDHLVFRDAAVHAADGISRGLFGEPPPFDQHSPRTGPIGVNPRPETPVDIAVPPVIEGKEGWMYLGDDVVTRCRPANSLDFVIGQLRRLRDGVEASGRKFMLVVAPDKTTMVPGYLPDRYVGQDCVRRMTDEFWRRLTSEGFVLDLRSALRTWAERIGRPVYPPLDAHWGDEGGLVMAQAMAEELRPGISDSWVISPGAPWLVPGDLPPLIGRKGDISGRYYAISPGGLADQTRNLPSDFTHPMQLNTASGPGTIAEPVGLLADSFTIRALRYLAAAFSDLTVLHYKNSEQDRGREAGEMLASKDVVAVELVERTVVSGNSVMLKPDVVDGIVSVLSQRPRR